MSEWATFLTQRSAVPSPYHSLSKCGAQAGTIAPLLLPIGLQGLVIWMVLVGSHMHWQRKEGHWLMGSLEKSAGEQGGRLTLSGWLQKETLTRKTKELSAQCLRVQSQGEIF